MARDVTERKREEAALARLAAIVESSADAILATDPDGRISEWNAGAAAMFGYTAEEVIGQPLSLITPPDERREQQRRWLAASAGGPEIYETFRHRKDGSRFRALLSLFPISDREGNKIGISTIVHDVTESYEASQQLERSSRELARSNAELEQFAYVASHDLQEPLRMVTGFMGLLERKYSDKLGDEAGEYIGFAVDGARRMQALIDGLLTYSRVGSKGGTAVPMSMDDAATAALMNLTALVTETGADVQRGPLPDVVADRQQMIQLYQNLIGNAVKFRGEKPALIELGAEPRRGGVALLRARPRDRHSAGTSRQCVRDIPAPPLPGGIPRQWHRAVNLQENCRAPRWACLGRLDGRRRLDSLVHASGSDKERR